MLNNFLYLRKSIEIILYQNKDLEHLFITENEWQRLERYKKIFEIFREPTKRLQNKFFLINYFIFVMINIL